MSSMKMEHIKFWRENRTSLAPENSVFSNHTRRFDSSYTDFLEISDVLSLLFVIMSGTGRQGKTILHLLVRRVLE